MNGMLLQSHQLLIDIGEWIRKGRHLIKSSLRRLLINRKSSRLLYVDGSEGGLLHSVLIFPQLYPEQKAPKGYTFIPAGDPQLTNRCKKLAREDGFTVFIVSVGFKSQF